MFHQCDGVRPLQHLLNESLQEPSAVIMALSCYVNHPACRRTTKNSEFSVWFIIVGRGVPRVDDNVRLPPSYGPRRFPLVSLLF